MALRRRRREPPAPTPTPAPAVDVAGLEPRWRAAVEEVLASRQRLQSLAAQGGAGPVQQRLASIAERIDTGVVAAWNIASRAQAASHTLATLDLDRVSGQLKDARRRLADAAAGSSDEQRLAAEVRMLADQHAALNQLSNAIDDAADRLRLLDLRLDAAVARAATVALLPNAGDELDSVERDLADVVDEITALRAGLDAVDSIGGG